MFKYKTDFFVRKKGREEVFNFFIREEGKEEVFNFVAVSHLFNKMSRNKVYSSKYLCEHLHTHRSTCRHSHTHTQKG